jgi:hypothetical protein
MQKMYRRVDFQIAPEPKISPSIGDQMPGISDRFIGIGVWQCDQAVSLDPAALLVIELSP